MTRQARIRSYNDKESGRRYYLILIFNNIITKSSQEYLNTAHTQPQRSRIYQQSEEHSAQKNHNLGPDTNVKNGLAD